MTCVEALEELYQVEESRSQKSPSPETLAHLEECPNCRSLIKLDSEIKREIKNQGMKVTAPGGLDARIASSIDKINNAGWKGKLIWLWPGQRWGWMTVSVIMLAVLLYIGISTLSAPPSVVDFFWQNSAAAMADGFAPDLNSSEPAEIDAWLIKSIGRDRIAGEMAVYGWTISGAKKIEFAGINSATILLRRDDIPASISVIPTLDIKIKNSQKSGPAYMGFFVGTRGDLNMLVWMDSENEITCALVSRMPVNDLIQLAPMF